MFRNINARYRTNADGEGELKEDEGRIFKMQIEDVKEFKISIQIDKMIKQQLKETNKQRKLHTELRKFQRPIGQKMF